MTMQHIEQYIKLNSLTLTPQELNIKILPFLSQKNAYPFKLLQQTLWKPVPGYYKYFDHITRRKKSPYTSIYTPYLISISTTKSTNFTLNQFPQNHCSYHNLSISQQISTQPTPNLKFQLSIIQYQSILSKPHITTIIPYLSNAISNLNID